MTKHAKEAGRTTTKQREWWGWYGSMSWLFFMMYGYQEVIYQDFISGDTGGNFASFWFMAVFAASIAVFSWRFGRDPDRLSRIAHYTTPVAIAMTAALALLPQTPGAVLYILSSVFMAPAITRRVYGVIRTSKTGRALTPYMAGIVVCVASFTLWMMAGPPKEIALIFPALLALPAWFGIRLSVSVPEYKLAATPFKLSKRLLVLFAAAIAVIIWLDAVYATIHTLLVRQSYSTSEELLMLLGLILPPLGFLLYAIISDKGHERTGFILGLGLFLIGLIFTLAEESILSAVFVPLVVTDNLGGAYLEFFILTAPIFLITRAKRPVFVASLGIVLNLVTSAYLWVGELVLPAFIWDYDSKLYLSAIMVTVAAIIIGFVVFDRNSERTLAAALYTMLRGAGHEEPPAGEDALVSAGAEGVPTETQTKSMLEAGLTQSEIKVALLLIDGNTRSDILRKLRISADEANRYEKVLRQKVFAMGGADPAIINIADEYRLTKREAEILDCLCREMTNPEIAAELFISEGTVKVHVHNILSKLNIETRRQLAAWIITRDN